MIKRGSGALLLLLLLAVGVLYVMNNPNLLETYGKESISPGEGQESDKIQQGHLNTGYLESEKVSSIQDICRAVYVEEGELKRKNSFIWRFLQKRLKSL